MTRAGFAETVVRSVGRGDFGHRHRRCGCSEDDHCLLGDNYDDVASGGPDNRG